MCNHFKTTHLTSKPAHRAGINSEISQVVNSCLTIFALMKLFPVSITLTLFSFSPFNPGVYIRKYRQIKKTT